MSSAPRQQSQRHDPRQKSGQRGGNSLKGACQTHYDGLTNMSRVERQESAIAGLRSYHNFIKAALITMYMPSDTTTCPDSLAKPTFEIGKPILPNQSVLSIPPKPKVLSVLDLCCGRGGDLQKWLHAHVSNLVMIDISGNSIQQAQTRYNALRAPHKPHVTFHVADCFQPSVVQPLLQGQEFDVVSCQFSAHYAFGDEETARGLFLNASSHLRVGGHVIMTVPDGTILAQRFFSRNLSNTLHSVSLKRTAAARALMSEPGFGMPYTFTLLEAVEGVPEYIVTRSNIEHVAKQCGLSLVRWDTFESFGSDDTFGTLRKFMLKQDMTPEEKFVSDLYRVAVFVKSVPPETPEINLKND